MTKILLSRPRQDLRRDAARSHAWRTSDSLVRHAADLQAAVANHAAGAPLPQIYCSHEHKIANLTNNVASDWTDFLDASALKGDSPTDMRERLQNSGLYTGHAEAAAECIGQLEQRIAAHNEAIRNPPKRCRAIKPVACGKTTAPPLAPATP